MRVKVPHTDILFTVLLAFLFAICALFTILIGAQVYENIIARGDRDFTDITALSYVTNKIRQGDAAGAVSVRDFDGINVLVLTMEWDGELYETLIYTYEGTVTELFCSSDAGLFPEDGERIIQGDVSFSMRSDSLLEVTANGTTAFVALRTGGLTHE